MKGAWDLTVLLLTACESIVISKTKGINYLKTKTPLRNRKMKVRISIMVKNILLPNTLV